MTFNWKMLAISALLSMAAATSASAQGWFWGQQEPGAYQAMHPDRDVLNGGALTPEAQMRAGGFAGPDYTNAYAGPRDGDLQVDGGVMHPRRHHRRP